MNEKLLSQRDLQKTFVTSYQLQITNNTIELIAAVLPKKKKKNTKKHSTFFRPQITAMHLTVGC